jgi:hypothetical protein
MKNNKWLYGYKILVNYGYGHGWEYECFELTRKEAIEQLRCYRANCSYPVRMVAARESNPAYVAPTSIGGTQHDN